MSFFKKVFGISKKKDIKSPFIDKKVPELKKEPEVKKEHEVKKEPVLEVKKSNSKRK